MAKKLYDETSVQNIANAIREKNGSTSTYTIGEMSQAINDLNTTGGTDISLNITGASVGQTVKISAVDANGVPTAWEPVNMDGGLSWIEVVDVTTSEQTKRLIISTDKDGRPISQYNALGMIAVFYFPADTSQTSNNGTPWICPMPMNNESSSYRYIANIAGWKTIARTLTMAWAGLPRVGWIDQISSQTTFSIDAPDFLDGLTLSIPASGDHIPAGTRARVAVLSKGVVE